MQIVIDIPKEMMSYINKNEFNAISEAAYGSMAMLAIKNGAPLPKGHGRIIDESKITQIKWETIEEEFESRLQGTIKHRYPVFKGSDAPTIIEADKTESEDKE